MHQTDAAGVVFYANLFVMAHDCYEAWLNQYVLLSDLIDLGVHIPIAHAEADYKLPIPLSEEVTIVPELVNKKHTSYTILYTFKKEDGQCAATVQTVHVCIDGTTRKPIKIPSIIEGALKAL
jgi:1,4-dihydroxy-2-naphthoyl-CoA hydrolase